MIDWWQDGAAIYASIVATAALTLEVRRWVESGPKLTIGMMVNAKFSHTDLDMRYLFVTVTNRGDTPTTITHLLLLEFGSAFQRWRRRNKKNAIVPNPSIIPGMKQLPYELAPGTMWQGAALLTPDLIDWVKGGELYVGIVASHADRSTIKNVSVPSAWR